MPNQGAFPLDSCISYVIYSAILDGASMMQAVYL